MNISTQTENGILTKAQVLQMLGMSDCTLYRRVKDGTIKQIKIGRKSYFLYSDLLAAGTATEPTAAATV